MRIASLLQVPAYEEPNYKKRLVRTKAKGGWCLVNASL